MAESRPASASTIRRYLVRGRVQGVFFRKATADRAGQLGLDGWVRNLADGRVETLAAGDPAALETFAAWLHQGPPAARVDEVQQLDAGQLMPDAGFIILSTR